MKWQHSEKRSSTNRWSDEHDKRVGAYITENHSSSKLFYLKNIESKWLLIRQLFLEKNVNKIIKNQHI